MRSSSKILIIVIYNSLTYSNNKTQEWFWAQSKFYDNFAKSRPWTNQNKTNWVSSSISNRFEILICSCGIGLNNAYHILKCIFHPWVLFGFNLIILLPPPRRYVMKLWTDFDKICWRGQGGRKEQVTRFWWRSGRYRRNARLKRVLPHHLAEVCALRVLLVGHISGTIWTLLVGRVGKEGTF